MEKSDPNQFRVLSDRGIAVVSSDGQPFRPEQVHWLTVSYYALLTLASTSLHKIHIGQNQNNRVFELFRWLAHTRPSQGAVRRSLVAHWPAAGHTHTVLSRSNANGKVIKQSRATNSRLIAGHRRKSSLQLRKSGSQYQALHTQSEMLGENERNAALRKMGSTQNVLTPSNARTAPKTAASVRSRMLPRGCYTQGRCVCERERERAKASSPHSRRSIYTSKLCLN